MKMKYELDSIPPFIENLLLGLQWFAVAVPIIIIIGKITGSFYLNEPGGQTVYLQKLCFVMAVTLLCQVLWGHRLPLVAGPSTVLLIGIIASRGFNADTVYSAILSGGVLLVLLSITGLFAHLRRLFTPRVVAAVLLLIAFTLTPTIMRLIADPGNGASPFCNISFALVFTFFMFLLHRHLKGVWKSTLIIWALLAGCFLYFVFVPGTTGLIPSVRGGSVFSMFDHLIITLSFDPGVLISFLFCFLALFINDLGSIESMVEMLRPAEVSSRITRGIAVTGLANLLSGLLGVIGPVNYSLSPGVIASTGCASRFTLIPTAAMLLVLAFFPAAIGLVENVPSVVIGSVLIYILCSQISAGLLIVFESAAEFRFENGLVIGLPILTGTVTAFLPEGVLGTFPSMLRPILGNGFVVGVISAMILEHWILKD
ncbi:MAG: uracil-xanthine permease family protein [Syntrophales bacterium]